jgi:hypothetical protein
LYIWEEVPKERLLKAPMAVATTTTATTIKMAMMAAMTAETLAMTPFRDASNVLCGLPSLHLGALRIDRRMFPGHGGDEAVYGGFGTRGQRQLQVPESQRAQVIRHGAEHEWQVVQ